MFSLAGLGHFWKNTGMAVYYHIKLSGNLLDLRYKKNKYKASCKTT